MRIEIRKNNNMRDLDNFNSCKHLENQLTYFNQENSPSHDIDNMSIIIVTRKRLKNRKKKNVLIQTRASSLSSRLSVSKEQGASTRHSSMPELNECTSLVPPRKRSRRRNDSIRNKFKRTPFHSKFIVNILSEHRFDERLNLFNYPRPTKFKIYRCEVGGAEDYCCCSCNSDAMFEIMRSLYECYKKKDCRNCTCILCSHLQPEEKRFSEKEKHLRELAMKGLPLPEGKTASEIKLINKVRTDLGAPIEPTTKAIRDKHEQAAKAGKLLPLEGKMLAEKEKILQDLYDMDIPLPKGRTKSEKALIAKITGKIPSEAITEATAPSEQIRRAKAEGLLTPLKDKTPEEREKILKRLAMKGLPLPEGQTPSENKLIKKIRADLGLPIEPRTKAIRNKHEKAAKAGKLLPLEGKTHAQKEKILKGLNDMGIPLPVGRTPSEKALIAKIVASPRGPPKEALATLSPSERMRRAKAEGLLTTIKGKTPEEREKILKGLAMKGLPLPEGQTPSENKLIEKVRADLGLPIEPKTKAIRDLHEKAAKAGKLLPLEGKTTAQKEKILKGLHDMDIPLPVGRTPSEKSLIAKIAASPRGTPKEALATLSPSERMRRAKAEGLLTTLKGKTPEERETILKGLAVKGLPLPEGQTPSENKLIEKVRADLGLPIEPKTKAIRDLHEKAAKAGKLLQLEGKTAAQKEKILKGLHDMDIPLPVGRTPSEKALIAKIKKSPRSAFSLSEQLRKAKAEGLLTPIKGKTPNQKENILKGLAMKGIPLPEAQSPSEKKLIEKVRANLGLPKDPTTKSMKDKHEQAAKAGILQPLEGKTRAEKEKVLKGLRDKGIPLPEGRTPSEKALIAKVKATPRSIFSPSEQLRKAKAEGLLTPLKGKPPEQKANILKGLAMKGLPLPEAQSPSDKKLIDKIRADLGLPKDPTTKSMKEKHEQAAKAGLLQPLEGKTPKEKERILKGLRDLGIPLPEGRTPSEKALIARVRASLRSTFSPTGQLLKAKAEGLLTPLKGKPPEQKEKILKGLAMKGLPLPEAQSPSEKILIDKVRADLGLPKDPTTRSMKEKHELAAKAGLLQPLEGRTPAEKAKILKGLRDIGIPLPEGRTPSEKALIANVKAAPPSAFSPSEQLRKAKAEGLLTPLKGKPPEQKEKILKGLAMKGLPLPEAQSPSEKKLIDKVRTDLGLPKDPTTKSMKEKHYQAAKAGLLQPLEGKTAAEKAKVLKGLRDMGIPLPEGRTPSEKALIAKVKATSRSGFSPSEQLRKAKAEGLLTPLKGKAPEQKEQILKGLAMKGLPLPEAQSPSEKKLIEKVRAELGLPKDPATKSMKDKHEQAAKAGLLQPLEGKTPAEKERTLKGLRDLGIPLPEGRTPSEKSLIAKVKASPRSTFSPTEQLRRAKAEGLLTPLKGKPPEQKEKILKGLAMKGLPLPEAQSPSEKKLIDKVRADLGLPKDPTTKSMKEKHYQAAKAGLLQPLEGKTPAEKERTLKGLRDLGIPLPEGRTPSEKAIIAKVKALPRSTFSPTEQLRRAKAEGLLTPLKGKPPEQKEKILKGLAMKGLTLPEAQSPSEKKLIDKVRADLGLPKDPTTKSMKEKHNQAAKAGLLQPLEGKTPAEKAKILKGLRDMGIPLPKGRTPSEKALIAKVKATSRSGFLPSEQLRKAKAEGLLTPLKGKAPEQKEKILKGLAMIGLPLPVGQTPSENKLIDKVRADLGLPIEPTTKAVRVLHEKAAKAGKLLPLEGKTPAQKEKILKGLHDMDIPLPVGRTPSEKALIAKVKALPRSTFSPNEQLRRAKAEGLLTPLKGKPPEQKEKILKGLAMIGLPLPEGQTPSENKLIDKVRADLGLPIEPTTKADRDLHEKAAKAGKLLPLEGKTPAQKEKILKGLHDMDIPLPVGRTPSEKALIAKIKKSPRPAFSLSDQLRKAKVEGLLTMIKGKTPEEKENILRGIAMTGSPLPEGQTPSENKLIDKVRADLGLPIEPKTKTIRDLHEKAAKAGKLLPLEGKTPAQKEKILKGLHDMDIPLPVGRTPSEKALIAKIKKSPRSAFSLSEQLRKAKAEGLLTTLKGKTPKEREKILRGLAMKGIPLPEGQTPSENKLIDKVRTELGVPIEPKTKGIRDLHEKAAKSGKLLPLEGKTAAQKEKILKGLHDMDIPLPVGRTPSEKSLIAKIAASPRGLPKATLATRSPSEQMRTAKAEGLLTTLKGKTPEERENILRGLAMKGLPLPEGQTPSENKLIEKVRTNLGVPIEPKTKAIRDLHEKAAKAGKLLPLEGKTHAQKEKILKGLHGMGIPLPVGRTPSEKALIAKIMASIAEKGEGVAESKKQAAGVTEQYEEIIKTTKCDRACGCDKKKIRFKHSYVKIKVTSPDISSFCDCPDECFPRVKSGVFIDGDGIKVTVGSAVGVPSFTAGYKKHMTFKKKTSKTNYSHTHIEGVCLKNSKYKDLNFKSGLRCNKVNSILHIFSNIESSSTRLYSTESEKIYQQTSTALYEDRTSKSDKTKGSFRRLQTLGDRGKKGLCSKTKSTVGSLGSILVIKSEMSLNSTISNKTMDTISLTSVMDSSITSSTTHFSDYHSTDNPRSSSSLEELLPSDDLIDHPATIGRRKKLSNFGAVYPKREYTIMTISQTKLDFLNKKMITNKLNSEEDPILLNNNLQSKLDVTKIMNKIISNKRFAGASSIFIVIPLSEDEEEQGSSNCVDSKTSTHLSKTQSILKDTSQVDSNPALRSTSFNKRDGQLCGKAKKFYLKEKSSSNDTDTMFQNESIQVLRRVEMMTDEFRQISRLNEIHVAVMLEKTFQSVEAEMTTNTASCCYLKERFDLSCSQKTPLFMKDRITGGTGFPGMHIPPPVASEIQCDDYIACPCVGTSHFAGRKSGSALNPDMYTTSQVLSVPPFQSMVADATTNTLCYCKHKERSDPNCSSGVYYSANVTSGQETPFCLQDRITGGSGFPGMHIPPPIASVIQCDVYIACPSVGTCHFSGRKSGSDLNPDMYTTSKVLSVPPFQSMVADATTNTLCYCKHKERSDPNCSSGVYYSANVTSGQETPFCLQDGTTGNFGFPDMHRLPLVSSVMQYDFSNACPSVGTSHFSAPFQSAAADASTNTSCYCNLKERSDLNYSSGGHYSANFTSEQETLLCLQGKTFECDRLPDMRTPSTGSVNLHATCDAFCQTNFNSRCLCKTSEGCHLPDMRTPSTGSLHLRVRCDVHTQTSAGSSHIPRGTIGCCPIPDMRTPSPMSLVQACDTSGAGRSSHMPSKTTGSCCLPDMRTPSLLSLVKPCVSSGVEQSWHKPSKKPGCSRLPDMRSPSAISLVQLRHSSCAIKSSICPSVKLGCGCLPDLPSPSTGPSALAFDVGTQTSVGPNYFPHYSQAKTRSPQNHRELLSHTITTSASHHILENSFKTTGPSQRLASQQSYVTKHFADEEHCPCEDIEGTNITDQTSIRKPRLQADRKSKMPIYSINDENCPCEDKEDTDITDPILNPKPRVSRVLKFPINSTDKEDCPCEYKDSTDITGPKSSLKPRVQARRQIKMAIDSSDKDNYIESTDIITDTIPSRQPRLLASGKSKIPIYSTYKEGCPCEDTEGIDIKDQISSPKPRVQASRKSKMPIYATNDENCPCEDKENTDITDPISNPKPRVLKLPINSTDKEDCPCEVIDGTDITGPKSSLMPRVQARQQIKMAIDSSAKDNYIDSTDIIPSRQTRLLASGKSKIPIYSTYEEDCPCEDIEGIDIKDQISSSKPRVQASRKIKMTIDSSDEDEGTETILSWIPRRGISKKPIHSDSEKDFPCDDIEGTDITDQIANEKYMSIHSASEEYFAYDDVESTDSITHELLTRESRLQASRKSKKSIDTAYEEYYPSDDLEDTDSISDEISRKKSRLQASLASKISIFSDDEGDYPCGDIEETDIIPTTTMGGLSIRKPRHQSSQKSKMPVYSADGYHCYCEDIESTNELSSRQPPRQAIQNSKKLKDFDIKDDFRNKGVERLGITTDETGIQQSHSHLRPMSEIPIYSTDEEDCSCEDIDIITVEISNHMRRFRAIRKSKLLIYFTDEENGPCELMGIDLTDQTSSRKPRLQADLKSKTPIYSTDDVLSSSDDPCEDRKDTDVTDQITSRTPRLQARRKIKTTIDPSDEDNDIQGTDIITDTIPSRMLRLQASGKSKMPIDSSYRYPCLYEQKEGTKAISSQNPHFQALQKSKKLLNSTIKGDFENQGVEGSGIITNASRSRHLPHHVSRNSKMPTDLSDEDFCLCEDEEGTNAISNRKPHFQASQKSKKLLNSTIKGDFENKGVERSGIITNKSRSPDLPQYVSRKSNMPTEFSDLDYCLCEDEEGTNAISNRKPHFQASQKSKKLLNSTIKGDFENKGVERSGIITNKSRSPDLPQYVSRKSNMPTEFSDLGYCLCEDEEGTNAISNRKPHFQTSQKSKKLLNSTIKGDFENKGLERAGIIKNESRSHDLPHHVSRKSYMPTDLSDEDHCLCEDKEGTNAISNRKTHFQASQKSKKLLNSTIKGDFENKGVERSGIITNESRNSDLPHHVSRKSNMPTDLSKEDHCLCDDKAGTNAISNRKPHIQASQKSKKLLNFTIKGDFENKGVERSGIITNESRSPDLPHHVSRKSNMATDLTDEDHSLCEDKEGTNAISNRKPHFQESQKSKKLLNSTIKGDFENEGVERSGIITNESRNPDLPHHVSRKSNMLTDLSEEDHCLCDDKAGTNAISNRKPHLQPSQKSKKLLNSTIKGDFDNKGVERSSIITNESRSPDLPHHVSRKSNMPTGLSDEDHSLCEDKEGTNAISNRKPHFQASQKSKKLLNSTIKGDFENKGVEGSGIITNESRNSDLPHHVSRKSNMPTDLSKEDHCLCDDKAGTNAISNRKPHIQASQKSKKLLNSTIKGDFEHEGVDRSGIITNESRSPDLPHHVSRKSNMATDLSDEDHSLCEDKEGTNAISNRKPHFQESQKSKKLLNSTINGDFENEGVERSGIITNESRNPDLPHHVSRKSNMLTDLSEEDHCLCDDKAGTNAISNRKPHLQPSQKSKKLLNSTIKGDFENKGVERSSIITNESRSPDLPHHVSRKSNMPTGLSDEDHSLCEDKEGTNAMSNRKPHFQASQKSKKLLNSTIKGDFENKGVERSGIITNESRNPDLPHHMSRKSNMPTDLSDEDHCLCDDKAGTNAISNRKPHFQASQKSKELLNSTIKGDFENKGVERSSIITNESRSPDLPHHVSRKSNMPTDLSDEDHSLCEDKEGTNAISNRKPHFQASQKSKKLLNSTVKGNFENKGVERSSIITNESRSPDLPHHVSRKSNMPTEFSDLLHCLCNDIEGSSLILNQIPGPKPRIQVSQKSKNHKNSAIKVNSEIKVVEHPGIVSDELKNTHIPSQVSRESTQKKTTIKEDYKNQQQSKDYATKVNCECQYLSEDFCNKVNCECQYLSNFFRNKENCECQHLSKDFSNKVNCECQYLSENFRNKVNCECQHLPKDFRKKVNCECQQQSIQFANNGMVQQQERASTKNRKITKLFTSIKKSLSHKIDKALSLETSKTKRNSKSQSQQTPLGATSVPSVCVYDGYPYEYNCGWIDFDELMRLRSELTETTSGFKACKKRKKNIKTNETIFKKQEVGIELDFEDAIKYYLGKNLEQFQDLIPPLELVKKKVKVANKIKKKQENKKFEDPSTSKDFCGCPYGSVPPEITYDSLKFTPEASAELAKLYPKGLKFSLGGTGLIPAPAGHNAARTVADLCCYANVRL